MDVCRLVQAPAAPMAPLQQMHSLPNVMAGVQQLQQIQPEIDPEEIDDTFKLSFQNTRKRSIIESYHCSGFKKMCIVTFIKMPEFTAASATDVSMSSLGSSTSLAQCTMQQGSQQSITQYMSPSSSQQSLASSTSSLRVPVQPTQHQFSTVVGTPKQVAKTIRHACSRWIFN